MLKSRKININWNWMCSISSGVSRKSKTVTTDGGDCYSFIEVTKEKRASVNSCEDRVSTLSYPMMTWSLQSAPD